MDLPYFQKLQASLFALPAEHPAAFVAGMRLAFAPEPGSTRRERLARLLAERGFATPEEAARVLPAPPGRWLARAVHGPEVVPAPDEDPLVIALILGRTGTGHYAPDRPILATEARLARVLRLWRPSPTR